MRDSVTAWNRNWIVLLLVAIGCTVRNAPVPRPPDAASVPGSNTDSATSRGSFLPNIYSPGKVSYEYHARTTIQSVAGDSIPRSDSSWLDATISAEFAQPSQQGVIPVTVQVDSGSVSTFPNGRISSNPLRAENYGLEIYSPSGRVTPNSPQDSVACSLDAPSNLFRGDEITPVLRLGIPKDRSWADTTQYQTCRGGVQLHVRRLARYRVEANDSTVVPSPEARLVRVAEITVTGAGTQWQQPVSVTGRGVAIDTLLVGYAANTAAPRLRLLSGSSRTELEFQSPIRVQRFLQLVDTNVRIR